MFCSGCGVKVAEGAAFCEECGAKLVSAPPQGPLSAAAVAAASTTVSGKLRSGRAISAMGLVLYLLALLLPWVQVIGAEFRGYRLLLGADPRLVFSFVFVVLGFVLGAFTDQKGGWVWGFLAAVAGAAILLHFYVSTNQGVQGMLTNLAVGFWLALGATILVGVGALFRLLENS